MAESRAERKARRALIEAAEGSEEKKIFYEIQVVSGCEG